MIARIVKAVPVAVIFIAWFYTYNQGINTAINIWIISEIFNHCFLVIPGAFFLIYQKKAQLVQQPFVANYWLFLPLVGALILYTFGLVGDIRLFMHIATFISLPLLIWLIIGNQAAKVIAFPLYFMLFAIPVGEQFIPYLQELTTDLAVPLLELTGVPIYRSGLYLDIPEGRFLVAEACSGISFLVASFVFGNLYAYISFRTLPKQLLFIFISLVVPIIANALRVYGIVLTAHLTDMEYAVGADHLIYGGVFYAIILFLLIMIGEKFRDKAALTKHKKIVDEKRIEVSYKPVMPSAAIIIVLFAIQIVWFSILTGGNSTLSAAPPLIDLTTLPFVIKEEKLNTWRPSFAKASHIQQGYIKSSVKIDNIDFFIATYSNGEGELISSVNKLYSAERWTLVKSTKVSINEEKEIQLIKIVSPSGQYRYIIYWYQFSNKIFTSQIKLKLYQTMMVVLGQTKDSSIVALSIESNQNMAAVVSMLKSKASIIQNSIKEKAQ
tara:strand:+ start:6166 stop:7650 length:1485 start_codon:yes stop_codon:yes gene_type:complete